ncbi:MAG: two-component regulator propeller domain-containing protein [Ginsengibacter sp.]
MHKTKYSLYQLIVTFLASITFFACNHPTDIAFPEKKLGAQQPISELLAFTDVKELKWDTAKKGAVLPAIKNLDFNALPAKAYDSTGFMPFKQAPEEVTFNFNSLPEKDIDLSKLPSRPLQFKASLIQPGAIVKAGKLAPQKGKPLSISDLGQLQGLNAKFVGALLLDHHGLLWIGASEGLSRYDGEHIQTFIAGSENSPPISGLTEDKAGNIWFTSAGTGNIGVINLERGTIEYSKNIGVVKDNVTKMIADDKGDIWLYNVTDKAMSIIDPVSRTYKNFGENAGLSDTLAFQMLQDSYKNIWITTAKNGVDIIDASTGKLRYLGKRTGLSSDTLSAMVADKKGIIWIATPAGMDAVDIKKGTIKHYGRSQGYKNYYCLDLAFDNSDNLWRSSVNGIELTDIENGKIRQINKSDGLVGSSVTEVIPDSDHRVWVATTAGLNMIDQDGTTVHPLGTIQIISQMEDALGNLWIGTQSGLILVNPARTEMRILDKSNGLTHNFVQSFWKRNGNMVVATNGGLNIIDLVHNTIATAGRKEGLVSDTIYAAFSDKAGNIWLTGPGNGIDLIDSAKKIIVHTDVNGGLSDNTILDIKQDPNGLIWLATRTNGVDVIDPSTGTVRYLNKQPGLRDTCIRMLANDKYGRMWIGTDKGIYIADMKMNTLTNISTTHGLSHNTVLSLLEYNGSVIAGTAHKISVITAPPPGDSSTKWKISILNKSEGIVKETNSWSTDAITKDGKYLWGDNGITIINDIQTKNDSSATYVTGMTSMTQPQYFIDESVTGKKDTVWTTDSFYIKAKGTSIIGYADKNEAGWDSVYGPYNMPANLSIPYNKNYLQFQFGQANLNRQDTIFYTYILEGIDKSWSPVTSNTYTENYLNLSPGPYALKVSSRQLTGDWTTPAVFKFTISPPWYQTWWAYTLFALIGIGLLRIYIVFRSRKLQKENRKLEEKVTHRTQQLKQSLEELRATQSQLIQSEKMASLGDLTAGIAHEIQNPLNFVNNFSEVNMELTDELTEELNKTTLSAEERLPIERIAEDIRNNQEKISFHGKRADSIVKGMLQHSRNSNGQKELTDINQLTDEYLRLAYHGLRAKDKSFNAIMKTDFDKNVGNLNIVPQDVGRVILNLITNAFYAAAEKQKSMDGNYQPTVSVSTRKIGNKVEVRVEDNGNGIPQNIVDKIFQPFFTTKPTGQGTGLGLSLSYDIIKAHGGEIKVETKDGKGSEFIIQLPVV